jgi:SAM-dependent methyltransferase
VIHPAAAVGFSRSVDAYERGRPEYPPEALAPLGLRPELEVLDLAAGSGKLTRPLLEAGAEVTAVEPVAEMRAALPDAARVLEGTAESIPLADGAVELVTVGQAFHWFDAPVALAEIRRMLRPDGGLALVWNVRDETAVWVARLTEVIGWYKHPASRYQTVDWAAEVAAAGGYEPLRLASVRWAQEMTRDLLRDRIRSISYIAGLPADEQDRVVGRVLELVEDFDEPFDLPHRTDVYWCRRG